MSRVRVTIVYEYEPELEYYDGMDPIEVDEKNYASGSMTLDELLEETEVVSVAFEYA